MARKKKGKQGNVAMLGAMPHSPERMGTEVEKAENGYIVHVSGNTGGHEPSYHSKKFVAHNRSHAVRIAAHHMAGATRKMGGTRKGGRGMGKKTLL